MFNQIEVRLSFVTQAVLTAWLVFVVVGIVNGSAILAQSPRTTARKFEVVSVRRCKADSVDSQGGKKGGERGGGGVRWDPQRLHEECQSLSNLIRDAYLAYPDGKPWTSGAREESSGSPKDATKPDCPACGLRFPPVSRRLFTQPIEASPGWVDSERYTIDATAGGVASQEMMRGPMMQAVLEERFKLKIHRESRDIPVYELTVAEGGPNLQVSRDGSCIPFVPEAFENLPSKRVPGQSVPIPCGAVVSHNGATDFPGTTIGGLCRNLSSLFDRDVTDKTGIAGFFDIHVGVDRVMLPVNDAAAEPTGDGDPPRRPQLDRLATFRAFQSALPKLGLKLRPAKGAGVFLVIDHVERPSGN
jgi:uncharacterized protein (TIGR03435 family)